MLVIARLLACAIAMAPVFSTAAAAGRENEKITGPGNFVRLPAIDESAWIVMETRNAPYWEIGREDPVLSNACRLREFASFEANRLIIRFNGEKGRGFVQVVPPDRRHLLFDARKRVRPGETYYFMDNALPSCRVWIENPQGRQRQLDPVRRSSLPRDPRALQNRMDQIRAWPKCSIPDEKGACP